MQELLRSTLHVKRVQLLQEAVEKEQGDGLNVILEELQNTPDLVDYGDEMNFILGECADIATAYRTSVKQYITLIRFFESFSEMIHVMDEVRNKYQLRNVNGCPLTRCVQKKKIEMEHFFRRVILRKVNSRSPLRPVYSDYIVGVGLIQDGD